MITFKIPKKRFASLALIGSLLLSACGSATSSASNSGVKVKGGTATWAELPAAAPNWIFPFMSLAHFSVQNINEFQYLMFRPLYYFGKGVQPTLNTSLSTANKPVFSNGNKTVTITMKGWKFSNGDPVDAKSVEFWMNMMKAEKSNWAAYVPGAFPDNVASYKVTGPNTIVFNLTKSYSPKWFTYNELSQITPLPAAWDRTSLSSPPGNTAMTVAGAKAVYSFLRSQAKNISTYATNPLWQVVDGPWRLQSFSSNGPITFVPNKNYSGSPKPTLSKFIEEPFTTSSAEFNVLRSGGLDVGYIPRSDITQKATLSSQGYVFDPIPQWGFVYVPYNFKNPTMGPVFNQLYIRQAIQHLVNQPGYIKAFLAGDASPTYGPIPINPKNPFIPSGEKSNPYPYSVSSAKTLLVKHGWKVVPNGITTCIKPGSGPGECGPGISAGTKLAFSLQYASGSTSAKQEMDSLRSTASKVGIQIALTSAPFQTVIGNATPTNPNWQMEFWGAGWVYAPDYYPTGGELFATGAGSNSGSFSNPTNDANIKATHHHSSALGTYANYLVKNLPVMYLPTPNNPLSEVKGTLHGVVPQSSLSELTPENWYFTK